MTNRKFSSFLEDKFTWGRSEVRVLFESLVIGLDFFLLLFSHQPKVEIFTESHCGITSVSFHRGSKLFTAITGFTMNCISDTDFCVSKK